MDSIDLIGALVVSPFNQDIAHHSVCDGYILYDGLVVKDGNVINSEGLALRVEKGIGSGCLTCFFLIAQCPIGYDNAVDCIFKPGFVAKKI